MYYSMQNSEMKNGLDGAELRDQGEIAVGFRFSVSVSSFWWLAASRGAGGRRQCLAGEALGIDHVAVQGLM